MRRELNALLVLMLVAVTTLAVSGGSGWGRTADAADHNVQKPAPAAAQVAKPSSSGASTTATARRLPVEPAPNKTSSVSKTTPSRVPAEHEICQQYLDLALQVGWPVERVHELEPILWRESRCLPHVTNRKNRNGSVDRGLLQINSANRRFLQNLDVIEHLDDLYDPRVNLVAGLHLYKFWGSMCPWTPGRFCK